jgi:hypothetical protein
VKSHEITISGDRLGDSLVRFYDAFVTANDAFTVASLPEPRVGRSLSR